MSEITEDKKGLSPSGPNEPGIYISIAISTVVGFIGVILRFVNDSSVITIISNIILIIGIVIALKAVTRILK